MLWFRLGAVIAIVFTIFVSLAIECATLIMCIDPSSARAMNSDPFYNGTLFFYVLIIISQTFMMASCIFGFIIAFRTWRNNHQLDHKLRHLFTLWLASLGLSTVIVFVLGILGIVRYREVQEEIVSLFEIFARYSQDVKFVGSFERYQRENSCCGINGPEDWMTAQFKSGGGTNLGGMGGYGGGGMDMTYMGSPSTGKCHLTPPTIPMGCGKKLVEEIHFTRAVYCSFLILEALSAVAAAVLGWYCFFYWIEKEVIIIPEDEVSNLIVIEPESSTSTVASSVTASIPSTWSSNVFTSNGSQLTTFSRANNNSFVTRQSGYSRSQRGNSLVNGYSASQSFYPNTRRSLNVSKYTKMSNFTGANPSIGGPHAEFFGMDPDEIANHNVGVQDYERRNPSMWTGNPPPPNGNSYSSSRYRSNNPTQRSIPQGSEYSRNLHGRSVHPQQFANNSNDNYNQYTRTSLFGSNNFSRESTGVYLKPKKPKKQHSFNHMLHKQEKALGGKVLAEMHVDHSRDPDPINSKMDTTKAKKGHRAHHATIAIIKNKNPPKPKTLISGPEKGHGQTGHLAADILDMSGGAAAARSLIDDINLPVEHDQHLTEGKGYVNKLHKARKKKSQLDHPDADHPGHGPVHMVDGKFSAPSIDGSQAQSLVDNLLHAKPKPKAEPEPLVKPHEVKDANPNPNKHHHEHGSHHRHHHEHHRVNSVETELLYKSKNFV